MSFVTSNNSDKARTRKQQQQQNLPKSNCVVVCFNIVLFVVQECTVADAVGVGEVRGESQRVTFHVEN